MNVKKKLLKNFFIQNFLGFIAAIYIYFVRATSKIYFENNSVAENFWKNGEPFILAFWHSQLMMVSFSWQINKKINILASEHSDGRFGSIVGKYFNLNNIPTSSNKQKTSLRIIFNLLKEKNYIGITPDGPRGPKEKVSEGIIKIAQITQIPIIPIGFWSSKNFNLKSWDSFLITLPFSKCSFVWGEPLEIPKDIGEDKNILYQKKLQNQISEIIAKAKMNCE